MTQTLHLLTLNVYCKTGNLAEVYFHWLAHPKVFAHLIFTFQWHLFYIITNVNLVEAFNFHTFVWSTKINCGWNFLVLQYSIKVVCSSHFRCTLPSKNPPAHSLDYKRGSSRSWALMPTPSSSRCVAICFPGIKHTLPQKLCPSRGYVLNNFYFWSWLCMYLRSLVRYCGLGNFTLFMLPGCS